MENENKCIGTNRPEFEAILSNFKDELSKLAENSSLIREKTCQLQAIREEKEVPCEKREVEDGIIGELNDCIERMRGYNRRLNEVKNGLIKLVG